MDYKAMTREALTRHAKAKDREAQAELTRRNVELRMALWPGIIEVIGSVVWTACVAVFFYRLGASDGRIDGWWDARNEQQD